MAGTTPEREALITRPFRYDTEADAGVAAAVPTAKAVEMPGYYRDLADAATANAAIFAMMSDPTAAIQEITVEGVVDLDFALACPRIQGSAALGLDPARTYRVVGVDSDGLTTKLTLWG